MRHALKQALRDRLSEGQRRQIREVREHLTLGALCARILNRMSSRQVARLKERLHAVGTLDFPDVPIHMALDSSMQVSRMNACRKEPETVAWIRDRVRPDDVLYDIGANVGAYSFVADAVAHGRLRIYAFEASFSTFGALSTNIFLNGCSGRIMPLHVALGRETRLCEFHYRDIRPGAAEHPSSADASARAARSVHWQPILSFRLDDLVREFRLPAANHIKLDVDGGELDVLVGGEATLRAQTLRSLLVEIDRAMPGADEIPRFLARCGFKVVSRHPRGQSPSITNYIFER
jgi:FkbM family methyltransferase